MCGTLCISEYNPSAELIFKNNELPYFNRKRMFRFNKKLFIRQFKFRLYNKKYKIKCLEFEDKIYMKKTNYLLMKFLKQKTKYIKLPFWYEYTFLKKIF